MAQTNPVEDLIAEETLLDDVDIPGLPQDETERRRSWRKLPQCVRIAVRRIHRAFGHVPKATMVRVTAQHPTVLHTKGFCLMNTPSTIRLVWIYWKSPTLLVRSIGCSTWCVWVLVFNRPKWSKSVQARLQVVIA